MSDEDTKGYILGSTAFWTAAVRARESEREDRLFNDPWAVALAGSEGLTWIEGRSDDSLSPIVIRTRFFDEFLQRITYNCGIQQVILMAAGLDTRAFRLKWPQQVHLFELDQGSVLEYKERILQSAGAKPSCARDIIAVDLNAPWENALIQVGFDPEKVSGWLLEGFLFYLSTGNLKKILERVIMLTAPGSYIGFDIVNSLTLTSPLTKNWVEMQAELGAPWIGTLDDPEAFMQARGWNATLTSPGVEDANYGRWSFPVIPVNLPGIPHLWFVTAQKEVHYEG